MSLSSAVKKARKKAKRGLNKLDKKVGGQAGWGKVMAAAGSVVAAIPTPVTQGVGAAMVAGGAVMAKEGAAKDARREEKKAKEAAAKAAAQVVKPEGEAAVYAAPVVAGAVRLEAAEAGGVAAATGRAVAAGGIFDRLGAMLRRIFG